MFKVIAAIGLALGLSGPALAQSTIQSGQPATDAPLESLVVRNLFQEAASDINGILGMHPQASLGACASTAYLGTFCAVTGTSPVQVYLSTGNGYAYFGSINTAANIFNPNISSSLLPTAPGSSSYTAACGQLVTSASAGGTMTVTAPSTAAATAAPGGCTFAVTQAGGNVLTVTAAAGQSIAMPVSAAGGGGLLSSFTLPENYETIYLTFMPANSSWAINATAQASNPVVTPLSYPYNDQNSPTGIGVGIAYGQMIPTLNENVALINNGVYGFRHFSTNGQTLGYFASQAACSGGSGGSGCGGNTFSANISWTGQSAIPVSYTGAASDTPATAAQGWCNALRAIPTLVNATNGFICDASIYTNGMFNLAWSTNLIAAGVTVTPTGTAGALTFNVTSTANLRDSTVALFDHYTPGYTPQAGTQNYCIGLGSQGAVFEVSLCNWTVSTSPYNSMLEVAVLTNSIEEIEMDIGQGVRLRNPNVATPAFTGAGTLDLPNCSACGIYMANAAVILPGGVYAPGNNVFGGTAAGGTLNLQSTQNASPSGDYVQLTAGNTSRVRAYGDGCVFIGSSPADCGGVAVVVDLSTGTAAAGSAGYAIETYGTNGTTVRNEITAFNNGVTGAVAIFTGRTSLGTRAAPTTVTPGTMLVAFEGKGYDGTGWQYTAGAVHIYAETSNFTSTSHPGEACLATTAVNGTGTTDWWCVHNDGGVTLGSPSSGDKGASTINVAGGYYINGAGINTAGGLLTGSTAAIATGALLTGAGSGTAPTGIADVAAGSLLASGGSGSNPAYCAACTLATSLTVPTAYGGTAAGSALSLVSTSNGSPSGDLINLEADNIIVSTIAGAGSGAQTMAGVVPIVQFLGSGSNAGFGALRYSSPGAGGALMTVGSSRGAAPGTYSATQANDGLGTFYFFGDDGAAYVAGATIIAGAPTTWTNSNYNTSLAFNVNSGATSTTLYLDLNKTNAGGVTVSTKLYLPGLTAGSGSATLCLNSTGSQVESDTSSTICGISALRFKNILPDQAITPMAAIETVLQWRTPSYRYKPEYQDHGENIHVSLIADDVAAANHNCGLYDDDGQVTNYADRCVEAYLVASIKELKAEIDTLHHRHH